MKRHFPIIPLCLIVCFGAWPYKVSAQEFTVTYGGQVSRTWNWSDGTRDRITMNAAGTVLVKPRQITCDGETFLSYSADLITSNHVWGTAIEDGSVPIYTYNFDVTRLVSRLPSSTYSHFTPETASYLYFETRDSVYAPPDTVTVYAWEYLSNLQVMRMWVALPNPFYYPDASYEHYDFPATHVVAATNTAPSCLIGTVPGVAGAQVSFGGVLRQTDAGGVFHYERIPPGTYPLQISKPGYVTLNRSETIPPFSIIKRTYDLEPIEAQLNLMDASPDYLSDILLPVESLDSTTLGVLARGSLVRSHATADGATRLLLHCRTPVPGTVTFTYSGPAGGRLVSVLENAPGPGAQATTLVDGKHYAFALYILPEGVGLAQAPAAFSAWFTPQDTPGLTFQAARDLTLCPTPVLMVHGLWGSTGDWMDLKVDLWGSPVPARIADYAAESSQSFAQNAGMIRREADKLLNVCRTRLGYAATRVDVVAHSMGGILTRIASNLPDYRSKQNFQEGYIRRLITVDTPHHGASSAPLLLHYLQSFSDPADLGWRLGWMLLLGKDPYGGAVWDLDPYTFANSLGGLAGPACAPTQLPAHTVACEATQYGDVDWIWETVQARMWRDDILDATLRARNPGLGRFGDTNIAQHRVFNNGEQLSKSTEVMHLWRTVFSGQANDGTVALPSQSGDSDKTTTIPGVSHVRAPHDEAVRQRILKLLGGPVENNFATNALQGVGPADLEPQKGWYYLIPQGASAVPVAGRHQPKDFDFSFGQPQEGSNVVCGRPVFFAMDLAAPFNWSDIVVALRSGGVIYGILSFTNPPFTGTLVCPSNVLGSAELIALGRGTNGDFRFASVGLSVQRPVGVSLVAMTTDPPAISLDGVGDSEALHVSGEFTDLVKRDITGVAAGTTYSLGNTNLATVDDRGRVTARAQGETWIDVANGPVSNRVALAITFRPPEVLALWPASLSGVAPTNLVLSISGLRFGAASGLEVLYRGQPAVGVALSNMNVVSASGFMTATLVVGQDAQPGRYEVVVTTPGGRSDATRNKGAELVIQGPLTIEASRDASQTLGLRVRDALERRFVLETSTDLSAWAPMTTNTAAGGAWQTNGIPLNTGGKQFFRARLSE
jgi:hypothetical protein